MKNNQPGLYAQLRNLPWRQVPAAFDARERGHGRAEWRTLKVTAVAAYQGPELFVDQLSGTVDANGNFAGGTDTTADVTSGFHPSSTG